MLLCTQCAKSQVVRSSGPSFGHWLCLLRLVKHTASFVSVPDTGPHATASGTNVPTSDLSIRKSDPCFRAFRASDLQQSRARLAEHRRYGLICMQNHWWFCIGMNTGHILCWTSAAAVRSQMLWSQVFIKCIPSAFWQSFAGIVFFVCDNSYCQHQLSFCICTFYCRYMKVPYCNSLLEEPLLSFGNRGTATGVGGWPATVPVGPKELHVWDVLTGAQWGSTQVCLGAPFHRYFINTACRHICSKHALQRRWLCVPNRALQHSGGKGRLFSAHLTEALFFFLAWRGITESLRLVRLRSLSPTSSPSPLCPLPTSLSATSTRLLNTSRDGDSTSACT